jgi:hypothetical protein
VDCTRESTKALAIGRRLRRLPSPSGAGVGAGDDDDEVGEDPVGDERLGTVGHELLGEHGVAAEVRDPAATELLTGRRVAAG